MPACLKCGCDLVGNESECPRCGVMTAKARPRPSRPSLAAEPSSAAAPPRPHVTHSGAAGGGGLLLLFGFTSAFIVYKAWPIGEDGFQWVAGGLIFLFDLIYRVAVLRPKAEASGLAFKADLGKHWLTGAGGPKIAFVPAWLFGIGWPLLVVVLRNAIESST